MGDHYLVMLLVERIGYIRLELDPHSILWAYAHDIPLSLFKNYVAMPLDLGRVKSIVDVDHLPLPDGVDRVLISVDDPVQVFQLVTDVTLDQQHPVLLFASQ